MNDVVQLKFGWSDIGKQRNLVPEGDYSVRVESLEWDEDRIRAEFCILDEGPHCGWTLYESFNLESYSAKFYEFLHTCRVNEDAEEVTLSSLLHEVLEVTVKHRKDDDDKIWANINRYAPAMA